MVTINFIYEIGIVLAVEPFVSMEVEKWELCLHEQGEVSSGIY
jgi:hypothetical protein